MAATVGSPSNHHSPRGSGFSGGGGGVRSTLHAPWAKVVRGEPESIPAVHLSQTSSSSPEQTSFTDCSSETATATATATAAVASTDDPPAAAEECSDGHSGNAAQPKKPVWNKLSNGVAEVVPPVIGGASSWPALSESTRASTKSLAADSFSKPVSNGSIPVPQGPVISNAPQKHVTNSNPASRHMPARQKSMRRGTGGSGGGRPAQSGFIHPTPPPPPPPPPPFPVIDLSQANYGNMLPVLPNGPPREPPYTSRPIAGFPPSHAGNDHFSHRNPSRRPRGDGHYHNNPGGRREHDRRNPEVNSRSSNGRDFPLQHQRAPPRGFLRPPPPGSPSFVTPPPGRPFSSPIAYAEMRPPPIYIIPTLHPDPFRSMPYIPHAQPPPFMPILNHPPLSLLLVNQIDYYFSDANLETDNYLKLNMDEQGWVPITIIANFPRVMRLTNDIHIILEALRTSMVVEVKDGKVRRRNEWMKYIRSTGQGSTASNSQSLSQSSDNELTTTLQTLTLEEASSNQCTMMAKAEHNTEAVPIKCSSEISTGELHPSDDGSD